MAGAGPSARYAHVLAMVANRFLVNSGGNDGKQTLADAWALDTSEKPYQWKRITNAGDAPSARCASVLCWPNCSLRGQQCLGNELLQILECPNTLLAFGCETAACGLDRKSLSMWRHVWEQAPDHVMLDHDLLHDGACPCSLILLTVPRLRSFSALKLHGSGWSRHVQDVRHSSCSTRWAAAAVRRPGLPECAVGRCVRLGTAS